MLFFGIGGLAGHSDYYTPPPDVTTHKDLSQVEEKLLRKDYSSIINSSDLFLNLFYKAASDLSHVADSTTFSIIRKDRKITITAKEHNRKDFEKGVEQIRTLFLQNYGDNKPSTIVAIDCVGEKFLRAPSAELIDVTKSLGDKSGSIMGHIYERYILPSMPSVAKSLGAVYSDTVVNQQYKTIGGSQTKEVEGFQVNFLASEHFIYPIAPVKIPERESTQKAMYELYKQKEQPLCNLTLRARDNEEIKMHALPLYLYGGKVLQNTLTSGLKESVTQTIHMPEFTIDVIKQFVEFIYLGPSALTPELFFQKEVDVWELLRMAHLYQTSTLIDCCTNLITLICQVEQAEELKAIAETYENPHLLELYKHLTTTNEATPQPLATVQPDKMLEVD